MLLPDTAMIAGFLAGTFGAEANELTVLLRQLVGKSAAEVDAYIRDDQSPTRAEGRNLAPSYIGRSSAQKIALKRTGSATAVRFVSFVRALREPCASCG
jgi:hypothetical protein